MAKVSAQRILYVQYTNPAGYPPLQHSSRLLAASGWSVLFLGTHAFGTAALQFPVHPMIRVLQMQRVEAGWRQKLHFAAFGLWTLYWIVRWRPTVVYVSDPLAAPVGLLANLITRTPVIYHEHDSPVRRPIGTFQTI